MEKSASFATNEEDLLEKGEDLYKETPVRFIYFCYINSDWSIVYIYKRFVSFILFF